MNLVKRYKRNEKAKYVLLQNMDPTPRMVMGTMLKQGQYVIIDRNAAEPYVIMSPDQSWMGIREVYNLNEYKPLAYIRHVEERSAI